MNLLCSKLQGVNVYKDLIFDSLTLPVQLSLDRSPLLAVEVEEVNPVARLVDEEFD